LRDYVIGPAGKPPLPCGVRIEVRGFGILSFAARAESPLPALSPAGRGFYGVGKLVDILASQHLRSFVFGPIKNPPSWALAGPEAGDLSLRARQLVPASRG
jgi:hypothetical protein